MQPFLLRKATFHDHRGDHDDIVAGIIELRLAKAVPLKDTVAAKAAASQSRTTLPGFVQRTLTEKKESFGIDRSVAVGPTVPQGAHTTSNHALRESIGKLEVRYRTAKFFDYLQRQIASSGKMRPGCASSSHQLICPSNANANAHEHARTRTRSQITDCAGS
jgi:hypothetical protein